MNSHGFLKDNFYFKNSFVTKKNSKKRKKIATLEFVTLDRQGSSTNPPTDVASGRARVRELFAVARHTSSPLAGPP